ncbi:MAG: SRPBCC family protein [Cohnella sp.]|nr:SRPBCC family protein [Cohnella sp.]
MTVVNLTKLTAEPGKQVIEIEREFEAPRELVFEAFTDAELFAQWMGPKDLTMDLQLFEARDGGAWRYVSKAPNGGEFAFCGVFHEVSAPERIVQTFEFLGLPERGHVTLETATFEALPGDRTRVKMESVFRSVADRDGMLQSGMEQGMNESIGRLAELLATRRAKS